MNNPFYGLMYADIIAYTKDEKVYCVLCVEELGISRKFPLFNFTRTNKIQYCDGCKAELSFKKAEWKCSDCGTMNHYDIKECDGCSFEKRKLKNHHWKG